MIFNTIIVLMFFLLVFVVLVQYNDIQKMNIFIQETSQRNRELLAENQRLEDMINDMIEEMK